MSKYETALQLMRRAEPDPAAARQLLDEAIAEGDARACYALATWYLHGTYVKKNLKKGFDLMKVAADQKIPDALFDLAVLYERGRGVIKDNGKAFSLFYDAAECGDPEAMAEVGRMFYYGIGVAENRMAADYWLEQAEIASTDAPPRSQLKAS